MRSFHSKLMILIFVPALLSSCATTCLADTWNNSAMKVLKHHKILLAYISKNDTCCRLYHDDLAGELNRRGVAHFSGHARFPEGKRINRQTLAKGIEESGADSVLTIKRIMALRQTTERPDCVNIYPIYWFTDAFPRWDMYGYFDGYSYYESPYIPNYELVKIQVNLFDAKSGKLLRAAAI